MVKDTTADHRATNPADAPRWREMAQPAFIKAYRAWQSTLDDIHYGSEPWRYDLDHAERYERLWRMAEPDAAARTACLFADRGKSCPARGQALALCVACSEKAPEAPQRHG